jgi:hypothetical protein
MSVAEQSSKALKDLHALLQKGAVAAKERDHALQALEKICQMNLVLYAMLEAEKNKALSPAEYDILNRTLEGGDTIKRIDRITSWCQKTGSAMRSLISRHHEEALTRRREVSALSDMLASSAAIFDADEEPEEEDLPNKVVETATALVGGKGKGLSTRQGKLASFFLT